MTIQFGIMNRGQYNWGDDMQARFAELMEQARLADKLGYDSFMKGSHFSSYPLHDFNQIAYMGRLTAECPNLRLIAGIVLMPLHKPLDIAEQFANIDLMSGGKLIFGSGLGYRDVEFQAFGIERKNITQHLEENIEAVRRLWTETNVNMKGLGWELVDATCSIRPLQNPPPFWIGANADKAIERAARIVDAWFVSPHNRIDTTQRQLEVYKRALDAAGKPFPAEFPMMRECCIAPTHDEAMKIAKDYLVHKYAAYHQWGQDKAMPDGDNDLGQDMDELMKDRFLVGTPDEVTEQVLKTVRECGTNHIVLGVQFPDMPHSLVCDQMQLIAEEVIPRVNAAV
jgi:alkanesulfonate monooxygenase SsuD/methylene tetrahydromethanopterin reductase-like flavin-dependent oxidoreductase (luciferase family)